MGRLPLQVACLTSGRVSWAVRSSRSLMNCYPRSLRFCVRSRSCSHWNQLSPVMAASMSALLRLGGLSPMPHKPLTSQTLAAQERKANVMAFQEERTQQLLDFAARARELGEDSMAASALDLTKDYISALTA